MTHEARDARKVVPRGPTGDMIHAALMANTSWERDGRATYRELWRAMYDAAPAQPEPRDPIGKVEGPNESRPYKHFVRLREPRDDEVGAYLYAIHDAAPAAQDGDLDALTTDLREIVQTVCACAKHSSHAQTCAPCIAADTAMKAADAIAALRARAEREKERGDKLWQENENLRLRAERAEAAIGLIWSLHVRQHVHLGLERASGVAKQCIPCICACALGESMDGHGDYTAADYTRMRVELKAGDAAIRALPGEAP